VLFGVSRDLSVLAQLTIFKAMGLPIEWPSSITSTWIKNKISSQ